VGLVARALGARGATLAVRGGALASPLTRARARRRSAR
jgi:hypothetical protein